MYHFIASFGLFEKSGGESFVIKYWLSSSTMELLWANKNFKYLGLAPHLNIAVLEMIMSYDDDSYDKLTCVWEVIHEFVVWFSFALKWYFVTKIVLTYCETKCSSDREKLLQFEAEDREFSKFLNSLEHFIQTVKGYFWWHNAFFNLCMISILEWLKKFK